MLNGEVRTYKQCADNMFRNQSGESCSCLQPKTEINL